MLSVRGIPAPWQAGSMHLSANRQLSCIVILSPCLCSPFPCWSSRGGFFVKVPTCGSMSDWPTFAPITSSTSLPKTKTQRPRNPGEAPPQHGHRDDRRNNSDRPRRLLTRPSSSCPISLSSRMNTPRLCVRHSNCETSWQSWWRMP
jgi:hypothetical protein